MNALRGFITGINYWPISKAMYWWSRFDRREVEKDFERLARCQMQVVRIFLHWEDFQPTADTVSREAVLNLKTVADIAHKNNLQLMPTFFCGHMSGINWFPGWMLMDREISQRFPVYSQGKVTQKSIRNCYQDEEVIQAQSQQIREVCLALKGHPAIFAYDLGNEASNCVVPPTRDTARRWLEIMSRQVKEYSGGNLLTLGMHAEDLEENRQLWPQDAAPYCDFLSMHAYPFYLSWVEQKLDYRILPFLSLITAWLGGKPVLLQEFGVPTWPERILNDDEKSRLKSPLFEEKETEWYYKEALQLLPAQNIMGALAWCYGDYDPSLWSFPPLEQNLHERYFGLFRYDGSSKPGLQPWTAAYDRVSKTINVPWLNGFQKEHFYNNPRENLKLFFTRYQHYLNLNGHMFYN